MRKENKNNVVNDLVKNVKVINDELNKIFDIACDESEISVYKSALLTTKLDALQILLKEVTDDLTSERKRLFNLGFKIHTIEFILDLITLILAWTNGFVGLGFLLFNSLISIKLYKEFNKSIENTKKCDNAINSAKDFDVVFENCYRLIKGHTNHKLETSLEDVNNKELRTIELANEHIEIAMVSGVVDNIPEDVRDTMVMMLQDDLHTDENDLIKLLEMANNLIEQDSLNKNEQMRLTRQKNTDFDEI